MTYTPAHHCPSYPCPICYPQLSHHYYQPGQYSAPPRGCICPPGAEATCQGFGCPRKGFGGATAASVDTRPKAGDAVQQAAPLAGGAVPNASEADAQ